MPEPTAIELPAEVPIMVLPGALLFPNALLPLYIFEERYRAMLAQSLAGSRMFCIALVKPGVEDVAGIDDFFHVAGCGLIRACVGKDDGTANLILQGLARVRFTGFAQAKPYRIARIEAIPSEEGNVVETEALGAKVLELCERFKERGMELPLQMVQLANLDMLADLVAHTFIGNPFQRQKLMEEPFVPARLRLLIKFLTAELK